MPITIPSITYWNRVEPRPRGNDFVSGLRAEIRDPTWMLARQRQLGEFRGEDTGSPAYVRVASKTVELTKWLHTQANGAETEVALQANRPLEAQILAEPHTADLATQVELGQAFRAILDSIFSAPVAQRLAGNFKNAAFAGLVLPDEEDPWNPPDLATRQMLGIARLRAMNGHRIWLFGKEVVAGTRTIPPEITSDAGEVNLLRTRAFPQLDQWVTRVYGGNLDGGDAAGWNPARLEYDVKLRAGDPAASATLAVVPDGDGGLHWSSFDLAAKAGDFFASAPTNVETLNPGPVEFPGMPARRFWDFEAGIVSLPDVDVQKNELTKLLLVDFALIYGVDWFVMGFDQKVGTAAAVDWMVVVDVFGVRTRIRAADDQAGAPGPERWSMFRSTQAESGVPVFTFLPAAAGGGAQQGPVLEDVRFGRDENANMAWGIERATENAVGGARPGSERDAVVDAGLPAPPPDVTLTAPLRYQLATKVPVHWVPLLPVTPPAGEAVRELEKAAIVRLDQEGKRVAIPATGKILNPSKLPPATPYRIADEEVPRVGTRVERLLFRSRWVDGSTHVWVARRKRPGAGESQSGLRFDAALPTRR